MLAPVQRQKEKAIACSQWSPGAILQILGKLVHLSQPTTYLRGIYIYHVKTVKAVMTSGLHSPQLSPTPDLQFHEMNEWVLKGGSPMFSSPSMQIYLWPADTRIPSLSLLSLPDWPSLFFFLKALLQLGLTYLFLPIFVLLSPFSLIYFAFLLELVQSQGLFSVHPSHRW